ncbi:MAG TPA: tetratricopeptide repeat protein [Candidatus Acidoferrum sp.]|nr:tetratricopeptide repeat protein [Candidatus Acidoferrum sp.]
MRVTTLMQGALQNIKKGSCALFLTSLSFLLSVTPLRATISAQSSEQTDALLPEAKDLFRQSKFAEADRAIRKYLESHPNSADGHFLLGHILFREIQAEAFLDRQLALQAQGGMGRGMMTPEPALPKDREEKAKASLEEFTAGARYRNPSAADLKIVAFDYIVLGDYPDADKWLTKMLEWAPNDSDGWYNLGRTKYNENRFAEAISAFQQCLKLDPKNIKAEDNLGLSFAGMGRNEEAAAAYQQAIAWQEQSLAKSPRPYIDLGSLRIDENRQKEAVALLLQAIEIDARDSKTHELLGKAYTRLEDFPKAQAELEKAIELSPQTPNLHCMLAPVYRKQGLAEKAKAEYERCATLTGNRSTPQTP